jgi:hypothetical protein
MVLFYNLIPPKHLLHFFVYLFISVIYFLIFLLECLTCFTSSGQSFSLSLFNIKITPEVPSVIPELEDHE